MSWLSQLIGADASHNAGQAFNQQKRLQEQAQALQQQWLANYQKYASEAGADRQGVRVGNEAYGQMGLADRNSADYNLSDLYSQYAKSTGVTGFGTPRGEAPTAAYGTPLSPAAEGPFGPAGRPATVGEYQTGQRQAPTPYDLSEVQQQSLNQGVDRINSQRQNAIANYRANALASGGQVNPAMEQYINEHYDQQTQLQTTQAAEAARSQREQGASALINQFTNQRNLGTSQYGQSLDRALSVAAQALASAEGGPYGQAANQTANMASTMQQIGQYNQDLAGKSFGDILKLVAFGLGGGFGSFGAKKGGLNFLPLPATASGGSPFGNFG